MDYVISPSFSSENSIQLQGWAIRLYFETRNIRGKLRTAGQFFARVQIKASMSGSLDEQSVCC